MRILFVTSSSGSRGGGEIYLLYLGRELAAQGNEVLLWASSHPRMDELDAEFSCFGSVIRYDYRNTYDYVSRGLFTVFNRRIPRAVAESWHSLQPDIVHLNKQNLEDGLDLIRATSYIDVPTLCTVHITQPATYLRARFGAARDLVAKSVLRRYAGTLIAVQERRQRGLCQFLGVRNGVHSINNGVPLYSLPLPADLRSATRRQYGVSDHHMLLVGIGRMEPQKRPLLYLDLAKEIYARAPDTRFLWVGDGSLRQAWNERLSALGLSGIVHCAGWQQKVTQFLAAADVFLHVAEYEGLPLALIEAMSAGLPCAIPRSLLDDFEVIGEEHVTLADELANFVEILHRPEQLAAVAGRGRRLVDEELSVQIMARRYSELYRRVLDNGGLN